MISPDSGAPSEFAETIRKIFSPDGLLSEAKSFEYRPEQQEMAVAVAEALAERKHLVVEAGTGVGKSLAYLIPAILWAKQQNRKAVVSTHTINLQEQLVFKDIPIVRKVLSEVAGDFSAILWKGRANYVCPTRLDRAMSQAGELFTSTETEELKRIWEWAQTTDDGSLSDLAVEPDSHVWSLVCSEPHICTPKTCGNNPRCHYQRVRKQLVSADLVVMNHTLFFLSLGGIAEQDHDESGYLFANDFVIFDEAHTVEGVASDDRPERLAIRPSLRAAPALQPEDEEGPFPGAAQSRRRARGEQCARKGRGVFWQSSGRARISKRGASIACGSRTSCRTPFPPTSRACRRRSCSR
jgi:ATP-dependent DNA helicase DinG